MSSQNDYLDGNAAAGELSEIFAIDITTAAARCANCGAINRFVEARVYMGGPGVVTRCRVCEQVLLRIANIRQHVFLDTRGMTYLCLEKSQGPRLQSKSQDRL